MELLTGDMEEHHAIVQPENGKESLTLQTKTDFANAQPDFMNEVFGNPVIFHRLAQYLNTADCKILRQTCKLLLSKVNGLRKFTANLQITVTDKNIDEYGTAMGGTFVWENVKIDISRTSPQHFSNIPTELIEELDLALPLLVSNDSLSASYELLESRQFPNLRSLGLDLTLLCFQIPVSALANVVGMGKLQDFRLIETNTNWIRNMNSSFDEAVGIVKRNLEMIGGLPWKLRSIDFWQDKWFQLPNSPMVLGKILASSASTLESIAVHRIQFGDIIKEEEIRSRFPRLRSIRFKLASEDSVSFAEFLRLQPPLESIHISTAKCCPHYINLLDSVVLDAIKSNAGPKLHTLRLTGAQWPRSFPELNSWRFIRGLTGLKDLAIEKVTTVETMIHLPTGMRAIGAKVLNCQEGNSQVETLSALLKFSNLLRLDLDNSIWLVNDAALQSICTNLTNLRRLRFGSTELTDFGITGESGDTNSGVSLRNLKGLRDLKMSPCGTASAEGLLKSIQLSALRRLELGLGIPTLALIEMASNNPKLKFLSFFPLSLIESEDLQNLYQHILEVCPELATIRAVIGWHGWGGGSCQIKECSRYSTNCSV